MRTDFLLFARRWLGAFIALAFASLPALAAEIEGQVLGGGAPIARSTVTLWSAGTDVPRQLGQAHARQPQRLPPSLS
jgi:hypothetical protein